MTEVFARQVLILVGQNNTGKTSFQRHLLNYLCKEDQTRLRTNQSWPVKHQDAPRRFNSIYFANRSYQELRTTLPPVRKYVADALDTGAALTILSSHADASSTSDIEAMYEVSIERGYNPSVAFFSNGLNSYCKMYSKSYNWHERLIISNARIRPQKNEKELIQGQLKLIAEDFGNLLMRRAALW